MLSHGQLSKSPCCVGLIPNTLLLYLISITTNFLLNFVDLEFDHVLNTNTANLATQTLKADVPLYTQVIASRHFTFSCES